MKILIYIVCAIIVFLLEFFWVFSRDFEHVAQESLLGRRLYALFHTLNVTVGAATLPIVWKFTQLKGKFWSGWRSYARGVILYILGELVIWGGVYSLFNTGTAFLASTLLKTICAVFLFIAPFKFYKMAGKRNFFLSFPGVLIIPSLFVVLVFLLNANFEPINSFVGVLSVVIGFNAALIVSAAFGFRGSSIYVTGSLNKVQKSLSRGVFICAALALPLLAALFKEGASEVSSFVAPFLWAFLWVFWYVVHRGAWSSIKAIYQSPNQVEHVSALKNPHSAALEAIIRKICDLVGKEIALARVTNIDVVELTKDELGFRVVENISKESGQYNMEKVLNVYHDLLGDSALEFAADVTAGIRARNPEVILPTARHSK